MFSVEDFTALMKAGEVRLAYSFCPDSNGGVTNLGEQRVATNQPELPSTSLFYQNYFGDRLKLTLGPIVKSHLDGPAVGRVAFGNFAGCVDLRDSGNCIELAPHEVISVATNERITLGGNVAAYILPRLTNADAGLLYVPSYIDPYWDGILQGVLVNMTGSRQRLHVCEGIAICRFYRVSSTVDQHLKDSFPGKSHHYGHNWPKILNEEVDPFPARKRPLPTVRIPLRERIRRWAHENTKLLQTLGVGGSVVVMAFAAGKVFSTVQDFETTKAKQLEIETEFRKLRDSSLPELVKKTDELAQESAVSGVLTVVISARHNLASQRLVVGKPFRKSTTSWTELLVEAQGVRGIDSRVEPHAKDEMKLELVIVVEAEPSEVDRQVTLKWLISS